MVRCFVGSCGEVFCCVVVRCVCWELCYGEVFCCVVVRCVCCELCCEMFCSVLW